MSKGSENESDGYPVGNKDPGKRGRGGEEPMGQKIPKKVLDQIKGEGGEGK